MSDDMDDLFNELFSGNMAALPAPTPEEIRLEAMTATELHIVAFNDAMENRTPGYEDMLGTWLEELQHYLPILEDYEEYEQCQKVFDAMREIRTEDANLRLNVELAELNAKLTSTEHSDEPDF